MKKFLPKTFKFSLTTTTVTLLLAALMIRASFWQWDRYKYKVALLESYKQNSTAQPIDLPFEQLSTSRTPFQEQGQVEREKDLVRQFKHKKIRISGVFDYSKQIIITNKSDATGPGHVIITPLKIDNSENYILVSRGFIPFADRTPETWTKYNNNETAMVTIEAVVKESLKSRFLGPSNPDVGEGKEFKTIWFFEEASKIAEQLPYPIITAVFLQQLGNKTFPKEAISIEVPPSTHFGYTIEWALLAFVSLVFGILMQCFPAFFNRRKKQNLTVILCLLLIPNFSAAVNNPAEVQKSATILQNLNHQLDLSLKFSDQKNIQKNLSELLAKDRPTIIAPVYFQCPRLCNMTLNGLVAAINNIDLKLGADYKILAISINPEEKPELADNKAQNYYKEVTQDQNLDSAFEFLTSDENNIKTIMKQLGFEYFKDGEEFAHSAGLMIITPKGKISRYFFGIEFPPKELRYSLIEASENKIGSLIDHAFLFCFRFDPLKGKYSFVVFRLMQLICGVGAIIFFTFIAKLWLKERKN